VIMPHMPTTCPQVPGGASASPSLLRFLAKLHRPEEDLLPGSAAEGAFPPEGFPLHIPASTKDSLEWKLAARRLERWPQLAEVQVRYRGPLVYVACVLPGGEVLPLCRLRYGGYASAFGFAIYRASADRYEDSILPSGGFEATPEEALGCACGLYVGGPPPGSRTHAAVH